MSEYQRYEFMTSDQPLTPAQLDAVKALSSHIDASSTHALVEYQWGDFKHDPIMVLHEYFDGFLYWANWGAPELAFRFPHGVLSVDLLEGSLNEYELDEFVTFSHFPDYDILAIHFGELEAPDEWVDYELGALMVIREELMDGDLRSLYIVWLASQRLRGETVDDASGDDDVLIGHDATDDDSKAPPVPPALGALTSAQQALADLLQLPRELLVAAARHSDTARPAEASTHADAMADWVTALPPHRQIEYLARLARNEPGLSRLLMRELRDLRVARQGSQEGQEGQKRRDALSLTAEHVTFAALLAESGAIRDQWDHERREQERLARQRQLQHIHDHLDAFWQRVDRAVARGSGAGYDEATLRLSELREVAERFQETTAFTERFRIWVRPHLRRPAFVQRLQQRHFPLPDA